MVESGDTVELIPLGIKEPREEDYLIIRAGRFRLGKEVIGTRPGDWIIHQYPDHELVYVVLRIGKGGAYLSERNFRFGREV